MEKKTYYALAEGDINGMYRKAGDPVGDLTDREAKYLAMHGVVSATKPGEKNERAEKPAEVKDRAEPVKRNEPDPATLDRKTR